MKSKLFGLILTVLAQMTPWIDTAAQQALYSYPEENEYFKQAVDLYSKEMYRAAQEKLAMAYAAADRNEALLKSEIDFYSAMCALRMNQSDAETLLIGVLKENPRNPHYPEAAFGYGKHLYEDGNYKDASEWFLKTSADELSEAERGEYYFKSGYSLYRSGDVSGAVQRFRQIKEQRNPYADAALYYYSHVEYENGNHSTALQGFDRLRNNPNYSSIVPYYTMQIAFIQKDYDRVTKEGEGLLRYASDSRKGEITRLLSEAYLYKGDIEKSLSYFGQYEEITRPLAREDNFLKGYIHYEGKNYATAAKSFVAAAGSFNDSLAQAANYYAGDCYIKSKDKSAALAAFMKSSQGNYDSKLSEDASFNYAKLALELNNDEKPVNDYLTNYPTGKNKSELSLYLASSLAKKGSYEEALRLLQAIANPTPAEREAIRKTALVAGQDLMKSGKYREASNMFELAMRGSDYDSGTTALARYWKAEASYRENDYASAASQFESFVNTTGSFRNSKEYKIAHYNVGYCHFKMQKYDNALSWFRKYVSFESSSTRKTMYLADSYNRIGDCYFKKRDYRLALDNYGAAESLGLSGADYAALQRAITLGFTASNEAKIQALQRIPKAFPNSKFVPAAYYETGLTYLQSMNYSDATTAFQKIISSYKNTTFYPKALVEMGLIEVNRGNNDKALSYYQQVIEKVPDSPEASDALEGIKNIYIDQNRMDEYFAYASRVGQSVQNPAEKDSLIFAAAEKQYQSGDCSKALPAVKQYLTYFPAGNFRTAANFYLADCSAQKGNQAEALTGFGYVIRQPENDFTETAWWGFARANYQLKNYSEAAKAFEQLKNFVHTPAGQVDAELGCMRSYVAMGNNEKAAASAARITASKGVSADLIAEATMIQGIALQQSGQHENAVKILKQAAKDLNKPADAEAKYRLIASYFELGKYTEAENEVYDFADKKPSQEYWLAKSFIVLGDIYLQRKDLTQAKATYESIISGYKNQSDGIKDEAKRKYEAIK
ncbi:MAG: tetratricopeptide repeat protein [Prevotellaceae bacterium]|jgi:TolA-binding protein|nr:tetratricopeptide repeat protein [Prevotellaceae bacterium]